MTPKWCQGHVYRCAAAPSAAAGGYVFSSANSINVGRLIPQIVYYYSAYLQLVNQGKLQAGQPVNFVAYRQLRQHFSGLLCASAGTACAQTDLCFQCQ